MERHSLLCPLFLNSIKDYSKLWSNNPISNYTGGEKDTAFSVHTFSVRGLTQN